MWLLLVLNRHLCSLVRNNLLFSCCLFDSDILDIRLSNSLCSLCCLRRCLLLWNLCWLNSCSSNRLLLLLISYLLSSCLLLFGSFLHYLVSCRNGTACGNHHCLSTLLLCLGSYLCGCLLWLGFSWNNLELWRLRSYWCGDRLRLGHRFREGLRTSWSRNRGWNSGSLLILIRLFGFDLNSFLRQSFWLRNNIRFSWSTLSFWLGSCDSSFSFHLISWLLLTLCWQVFTMTFLQSILNRFLGQLLDTSLVLFRSSCLLWCSRCFGWCSLFFWRSWKFFLRITDTSLFRIDLWFSFYLSFWWHRYTLGLWYFFDWIDSRSLNLWLWFDISKVLLLLRLISLVIIQIIILII